MQDANDFDAEEWQEQTLVCDMRKIQWNEGQHICNPQEETNKYAIWVCLKDIKESDLAKRYYKTIQKENNKNQPKKSF